MTAVYQIVVITTSPIFAGFQPASQPTTNPWGGNISQFASPSWGTTASPALSTTATVTSTSSYNPFATAVPSYPQSTTVNGSQNTFPQPFHAVDSQPPRQQQQQQQQLAFAHTRSHSIDTGEIAGIHWQQSHPLRKPATTQNGTVVSTSSTVASSSNPWPTTSTPSVPSGPAQGPGVDPFDVAWAAKTVNKSNSNPFETKSVKKFEVQL